ncbi:hypothetical protein JOB18_006596 [Solea senegalensis]|uniref:Uncharacterized protein n=1 Tax=Solea senegalensis TaxID=28829 RepID=A0AAV6QUA1_SOLSE|nr:hypothetical protein JOB18_006596 [Solea senegalensis]
MGESNRKVLAKSSSSPIIRRPDSLECVLHDRGVVTRRSDGCHHHMADGKFHSVSMLVKWEGSPTPVCIAAPPPPPASNCLPRSSNSYFQKYLRLVDIFAPRL